MPANIQKILTDKADELDRIPTALVTAITQEQRALLGDLLSMVNQLDRDKGGAIMFTRKNERLIGEIVKGLQDTMLRGEYANAIETFSAEMTTAIRSTDSLPPKIFGTSAELDTSKAAAILRVKKEEALRLYLGDGLAGYFLEPLRTELTNAVISGASVKSLSQNLRTFMLGDGNTDGRLKWYVQGIAYDTVAVSDRAYTRGATEDLGLQWYYYVGGMKKTTRPFCESRNGKFFHVKEVESWASLGQWEGRMPGTDAKTIFLLCGGYRCQHSLLPVSEAIVPPEDIERARAKGFVE